MNARDAAIKAGYSEKTAYSIGSENLTKPEIKEYVDSLLAEAAKRNEISKDFVLQGLKEVAERCLQRSPVMDWDYKQKQLVQRVDDTGCNVWEFDSAGANKAFELLGKHLGLFKESDKLPAEVEVTLNIK